MKHLAIGALLVTASAAAAALGWRKASSAPHDSGDAAPVACRVERIGGAGYRVCEIAPGDVGRLRLMARDDRGRPVRTIARVDSIVRARGERLRFATNAGLYHRADLATGMLVADGGRVYSPLNRDPGPPNPCAVANFYCPPNAVFFVAGGRAAVLATEDFARRPSSSPRIELATQSGPMLVRRGELARTFDAASRSRLVRNGVGVRADGTVVFAIADGGVSFHQFASAFRDVLDCRDAVFLDGTIAQMYSGARIPPPVHEFAAIFVVAD
jgi:uncharacterized protein YigE (DUF2233 family)